MNTLIRSRVVQGKQSATAAAAPVAKQVCAVANKAAGYAAFGIGYAWGFASTFVKQVRS